MTSNKKLITKIFLPTFFSLFLANSTSLAWDGIEPKTNSAIKIESGNLVREGSIIDFYDSSDGNYHTGKVVMVNSVAHATELTIEDFAHKNKERLFLMNE